MLELKSWRMQLSCEIKSISRDPDPLFIVKSTHQHLSRFSNGTCRHIKSILRNIKPHGQRQRDRHPVNPPSRTPEPKLNAPPLIREFNEVVNMTASELKAWLKEEQSTSSGRSKSDGPGETIGHERSTSPFPSLLTFNTTLKPLLQRP